MVVITLVTRESDDGEDSPEVTYMVSRVPCRGELMVLDSGSYVVDDVAHYTFSLVDPISDLEPVAVVWAIAEADEDEEGEA